MGDGYYLPNLPCMPYIYYSNMISLGKLVPVPYRNNKTMISRSVTGFFLKSFIYPGIDSSETTDFQL